MLCPEINRVAYMVMWRHPFAKHSVHIGYDIQYMLNSELILHVKQLVRSRLCVIASPLGT
jgi:hypothetical protein